MNKKIAWLSGIFVLALAGVVTTVQAVSVQSGSNKVPVYSCVQVGNDIKIRRTSSQSEYILTSTCRDAGHGMRQYTMSCTSNKEYKVSWTECSDTPQPQVNYVFEDMSVSALSGATTNGYLKVNGQYWAHSKVTVPASWPAYNVHVNTKNGLTNANSYTYAFAWVDKYGSTGTVVNPALVKQLIQNTSFNYSLNHNFAVSDSDRGKVRTVLAFARDNDGISRVPNMPVEVDDIIALDVYLEPNDDNQNPNVSVNAHYQVNTINNNTYSYQVNLSAEDMQDNIKGVLILVHETNGTLVQTWWLDNKNASSPSEIGFGTKNLVRSVGKSGLEVGKHYKVTVRVYTMNGDSAVVTAPGEIYVGASDTVPPTINANVTFASVWDSNQNFRHFVPTVFASAYDNVKVTKIVLYHNTTQSNAAYNVVKTCENSNGLTTCSHTFDPLTRGNFYAQAWDAAGNSVNSVKYAF